MKPLSSSLYYVFLDNRIPSILNFKRLKEAKIYYLLELMDSISFMYDPPVGLRKEEKKVPKDPKDGKCFESL